ncbi:GNAT family N-acetyltransferase [Mycetocola spongiae]|uniref:GNAT family N-acetyltransferase n=1 Tax=Mycetocola spongiae TaxID=2859226 RepID=UPI001CF3953D|nr:GNAT family N-acetyltransferase [Mycetocola spongiae]UCR88970.1 GNAT family N-acetyltransferase [Mycetocola spongiae]
MPPQIRPFHPADAPGLTRMLHLAYAELGARGLNFTAVDQDVGTTLERCAGGLSWVAEAPGPHRSAPPLGTLTLTIPPGTGIRALTPAARVPGRAWLNQLAVDPGARGTGLARILWETGLRAARAAGCTSIGLDTAEPASHLLALYERWGFTRADTVRWPEKNYDSAILLRPLA